MVAINSEFYKRGWILEFQPSNPPVTNIKDYCIFPAMSKAVTAMQGLKNGSLLIALVLRSSGLWGALDNRPSVHESSRVVNAIEDDNGGDAFVREEKALHFGIRQLSVPYYCTMTRRLQNQSESR
jgi:hypothetical protein